MHRFVFALLFVLCLLVAFPRTSAEPLQLPELFSAQFSVFARNAAADLALSTPNYRGTLNYIQGNGWTALVRKTKPASDGDSRAASAAAEVKADNDDVSLDDHTPLLYRNGRLILSSRHPRVSGEKGVVPQCISASAGDVPPFLKNLNVHMLRHAVQLNASLPTFDREVNACLQDKSLSTFLVQYHGEPFVLCAAAASAAAAKGGLVEPRRIISNSMLVRIDSFSPGTLVSSVQLYADKMIAQADLSHCRAQEQQKLRTLGALPAKKKKQPHPAAGDPLLAVLHAEAAETEEANYASEALLASRMMQASPAADSSEASLVDLVDDASAQLTTRKNTDQAPPKYSLLSPRDRQKMKLLWFLDQQRSCSLAMLRDAQVCDKPVFPVAATDEPQQKVCIFLHGAGQGRSDKGEPVQTYPDYWGNVHQYTPQCSERWFIREETLERGWDSLELQHSYCSLALKGQPEGDRIIRNKVLFVHSMGNLILAAAIQNRICDVDVATTGWYEIQGPFSGSKAADTLHDICLAVHNSRWNPVPAIYYYIASSQGYCEPGSNLTAAAYKTLSPSYPGLANLYPLAQSRIRGALCGSSPVGLLTTYSAALKALATVVGYDGPSDGMVPQNSCHGKLDDFQSEYTANFYFATVNHADGTCRNDDGHFSIARKPCSWYTGKL